MQERGGGQDAEFCIDTGSGHQIFSAANFPGQIFSRNYVDRDPIISQIGLEESLLISDVFADVPLFTTSSQPQSCIVTEDGSCIFTWIINGTGLINTSYNITVTVASNFTSINDSVSNYTTISIVDSTFPTFTLIAPLDGAKIIGDGTINLSWIVNDDDTLLNCTIIINSNPLTNVSCGNGVNTSYLLLDTFGRIDWQIAVNDSEGNYANSSLRTFYSILNSSSRVSKRISGINSDQYFIDVDLINRLSFVKNYTVIDYVDNLLIAGSFSPLFDFFNITVNNPFAGRIYGWNSTGFPEINYSISGVGNYNLSENYILGLE